MRLLLLSVLLLASCAPLVEVGGRVCPSTEELLELYARGKTPKEFRIYGMVKYGPVRIPVLIAKFDDLYTVRVPRGKDLRIEGGRVCLGERCYLLPLPPENLVFGGVISGGERESCRDGLKYLTERDEVYERTAVFEGNRLREFRIRNLRNGRTIRVEFGPRDPAGFFREIRLEMGNVRFKLLIEEVEV
jgi:hypothetical protein